MGFLEESFNWSIKIIQTIGHFQYIITPNLGNMLTAKSEIPKLVIHKVIAITNSYSFISKTTILELIRFLTCGYLGDTVYLPVLVSLMQLISKKPRVLQRRFFHDRKKPSLSTFNITIAERDEFSFHLRTLSPFKRDGFKDVGSSFTRFLRKSP